MPSGISMVATPTSKSIWGLVAMPENVRCIDCGFLSFYEQFESNNLVPVTRKYRTSGESPPSRFIAAKGERNPYDNCPVCFVNACDLTEQKKSDSWRDGYEVAVRPRSCDDFEQFIPGLEPREHIEVIKERLTQAMQAGREQADREWREKQENIAREWRTEDLSRQHTWRQEDRSLAMSNLLVACAVGIMSVVGTLIAAKLIPWLSL